MSLQIICTLKLIDSCFIHIGNSELTNSDIIRNLLVETPTQKDKFSCHRELEISKIMRILM